MSVSFHRNAAIPWENESGPGTATNGPRDLTQPSRPNRLEGYMKPTRVPTAIQTRYAGCHFRSRLEARWAVFFDTLGVRWEYEPQGYQLPSGPYLPDFWLPDIKASHTGLQGLWFEIKPDITDRHEDARWREFAETGQALAVTRGLPRTSLRPEDEIVWDSTSSNGRIEIYGPATWDNGHAFCICLACGRIGLEFEGRWPRICGIQAHGRVDWNDDHSSAADPELIGAYTAARSARFEHGQSGASA